MRHQISLITNVLTVTLFLTACGGGGGSNDSSGNHDTDQLASAARTSVLPGSDTDCPNGGILVETGIDENGNGELEDNEVDSAEKVCHGLNGSNGANGSSGLNALVSQSLESAGTNCPYGGIRFDVGIDNNPRNNVLDSAEITSTEYICNPQSPLSTNARLDGLVLSTSQLDQLFQSSQTEYSATVGYLVKSISVSAWTEDEQASLRVNGVVTASGTPSEAVALNEGATSVTLSVTAEDGVTTRDYTLTVLRQGLQTFAQNAYIKASNTDADDLFGLQVSLSGDTLAVGTGWEDSAATGVNGDQSDNSASTAGAVYIFTRSSGIWRQQAYLKASNAEAGDFFGFRLSLSGNTLAVGAQHEDSAATGVNGDQSDNHANNAGAVYVFTRYNGAWSQQAYLKASNTEANDWFGSSVALSGDMLAVGATGEDSTATGANGDQTDNSADGTGAVYVFTRSNGIWSQQAYLKPSNPGVSSNFGNSVSLSGDSLAVGADYETSAATGVNGDQSDNTASYSGAVYVFTSSNGAWSQQAYLKASNTDSNDYFGTSVSLSGDTLAVGAEGESSAAIGVNSLESDNSALAAGAAYVFTRSNGEWSQQAYIKPTNTGQYDFFGSSVSLSGDTLAVGAYGEASGATGLGGNESDDSAYRAGAAYVFTRSNGVWSQQAYLKASNTLGLDQFGLSVSLSDDTLAVGAINEDSAATGVNGDQSDDSVTEAGAVYVFN
jgi:hypothetical protein